MNQVVVPDIGDFKEVEVIEVLVKPGDAVSKEQSLITLESDKATMEVPSPAAGTVKEVKLNVGDKVSEGALILLLETAGGAAKPAAAAAAPERAAAAPVPAAAPTPAAEPAPPAAPEAAAPRSLPPVDEPAFRKAHASPAVRAFARELGVDLARLKGTGPKDRILKEDVQNFVKSALAGAAPAAAAGGGVSGGGLAEFVERRFESAGELFSGSGAPVVQEVDGRLRSGHVKHCACG